MKLKRRTRKQLPALIGASAALAISLGGLSYVAYSTMGQPTADQYGCFDEINQPHTFVLFDASHPRFNAEQTRSLRQYFDQLYADLGLNERLRFFTSESDRVASVGKARFHICGQARNSTELEAIGAAAATSGYLRKQRQRLYEKILAPELDALLSDNPDESRRQNYQSPIMEMIADLSRMRSFVPGTRLIIVSDLLQSSDSARFCTAQGDMPPFSVFKNKRIYQNRLKPRSLEGIEVEVLMLQRAGYGHPQGLPYCRNEEELAKFWRDYLVANGVDNPSIIRIRIGASGA